MISTIFTNFFNCLSLPTVILNNTFSTVFTYKYDSNIESSFYLSQAIAIIKKSNYNPGAFTINIQKNITYSIIAKLINTKIPYHFFSDLCLQLSISSLVSLILSCS